MRSDGRKAWVSGLARLLLVFSPAALCAVYVATNAVNVPVADDWGRAALLAAHERGELTLAKLWEPTPAGDRPLLPRALVALVFPWSGGNLLVEIALTFLALLATAVALHFVVGKTYPPGPSRSVAMLAINLALFSPVAYEALLWASRLGAAVPVMGFGLALAGLCSGLSAANKTALCAACGLAASLCAATGLAVWPALMFAAWCGAGDLGGRARALFTIALATLAAVTLALYLPGSGLFTGASSDALFAALGSPVARFFTADVSVAAATAGRALVVVFAAGLALLGRRWAAAGTRARLGTWLAAGWFAVLAAAIIAFRAGATGAGEAVLPRHITTSALLPISLVGAAGCVLSRWAGRARPSRVPEAARLAVAAAAGGAALAVFWPGWVHGSRKMEQWKSARLQARAALVYWEHHGIEHPERIDPDPIRLATSLPYLQSKGWIEPAPLAEFGFGDFVRDERRMAPSDFKHATIREASYGDGVLFARGHAALPGSLRAADGVLLTWRRDRLDPWKPVSFAEPRGQSVAERLFTDTNYGMGPNLSRPRQFSKWMVQMPWPHAPAGEFELGAWMLDAERMRAYPLDGAVRLGGDAGEGGGA